MVFAATVLAAPSSLSSVSDKNPSLQSVSRVHLPFIANEGQISDKDVKYYTRTFGGYFYVRENGEMVYLQFSSQPGEKGKKEFRKPETAGELKTWVIKETLINAKKSSPEAKDPAVTKVNSFVGRDQNNWKTGLSTYHSVSLGEVYEGISLSLKAYGNSVEKIFTVSPGADAGLIRLRVEGGKSLTADEKGHLEVLTGLGPVTLSKPVAYQEKDGNRVDVAVSYLADGRTYGFKVGEYDKTLPLVIDPYLQTIGSYLGGSGSDYGNAVAVDVSGNIYITGGAGSSQFLTIGNPVRTYAGGDADAYVAKIKPDGTLSYFTFLGGGNIDFGDGIAVDSLGNAWITGYTESSYFPATVVDPLYLGAAYNTFVTELNPTGSLIYSTLISPGSLHIPPVDSDSQGRCIALDGANVIVGGSTLIGNEPLTTGYVVKLTPPSTIMLLAKYDWFLHNCIVYGVAVDAGGKVYVTGVEDDYVETESAFVASYTQAGGLNYLKHLRNVYTVANRSVGSGVAVDVAGTAYVTGYTNDKDFPATTPIHGYAGGYDSFVTKIGTDGTILFSSFLGGNSDDKAYAVAVDAAGNVYVAGSTQSSNFPTTGDAYQRTYGGSGDAFVAKIDPTKTGLNSLVYSSFLGGSDVEDGAGMAVDTQGSMYVTGITESLNFPTTAGALQASYGGLGDTFVVKFEVDSDGDGMPDSWETLHGVADPNADPDGDGLSNLAEYQNGTDPNDSDTDGDGVNDGQEVSNGTDPNNPASFTAAGTGVISGTVRDASGNTIAGGNFTLALVSGDPCGGYMHLMWVGISPNGDFSFTNVPPGNYYVVSNNQNQSNYVNEWWNGTDGSYVCSTAIPVAVGANSVSSGINFRLEMGGSITGSITNGAVGIPNVCLNAISNPCGGSWLAGSQTDASGNYTVRGVPAGNRYLVTYTGCAADPQTRYYIDEWWNGQKLNTDCSSVPALTVQAGVQQTINFSIELGGSISGRVTTEGGQPLQGVCVNAYADRCRQNWTGEAQTGANGEYTITALPVGDYFVVTSVSCGQPETNIKDEWYNDFKLSGDCNRATPVVAPAGVNTQNINFELSNSFSISGSVMHIHEAVIHSTYLEVSIGSDFLGSVPGDITSVRATSPTGNNYPLTLDAQFNVYGVLIGGLPEIGTWNFTVTSSDGATGTDTDHQYIIRDIPLPQTALFKSDLTTSTPSFSWAPVEYVPPAGFHKIPLYYRLEISQDNGGSPGNRVFASDRALNRLHYTVPAGKLSSGNYLWRVRVYDSADWKTVQNRANSDWVPITISAASTGNHARKPAIDPDQWGTVTWNETQRLWSVKIIDHDGVAGDGSSHTVTVSGPGGTFGPFGFDSSITPYSAYYSLWNGGAPPATGTYTFTVTDPQENQGTFTETFTHTPVDFPDVSTFNQSVRSESVSAVFDNVFVNGQPYDDFNSYSSINNIDYSRWSGYEGANIVSQQLLLATGVTVGRASASLNFAKPETITSIKADIKLAGSTSENARAEIAGSWGNNGKGDIWAKITVLPTKIFYSVSEEYLDEDANFHWTTLSTTDVIPSGSFLNTSIPCEIIATINPGTKIMTLSFTAGTTTKNFQVPNILGPPVLDIGKQLRTRVNLVTAPVTEFTLDPVPGAERYRLGIYRWDNKSRLLTVMGYNDPATGKAKIEIPPGMLNPGSYFRYRIEAWDAPDPLDVNGVSKMPADNNDNFIFYTAEQEPQAPFLKFDSHGVAVLKDSIRGPHLSFVAEVHDAQGVPGTISSVKVRHPSGAETSLDYQLNWRWGTNGPTKGYYWARSLLPIQAGPYTFTVRDLEGNEYSRVEQLSPLATPLGFPAASSLVATPSATDVTAVVFDWADVPGIGPNQGFYRLEIFDYDFNLVAKFATTQSQFSLKPGILKEGFYRWRVSTRWEYWSDNVDNGSNSPASLSSMPYFVTSPLPDSDQDGLPDFFEQQYGQLNPNDDLDGDGLVNLHEYLEATNPTKPDTDGDGVPDGTDAFPLDPSASIDDRLPPTSEMTEPAPGATSAPIGTNIVVHIRDGLAGVDAATIVMKVNGVAVYPGALTSLTGAPADYTLTYNPPADFGYSKPSRSPCPRWTWPATL